MEKGGQTKDFDIWYVERTNGVWGEPVNVGSLVNTPANEFYPSVTASGTLYWCAVREGGQWTRARNMGMDSTRIKTTATYGDVVEFSKHPGNKQSNIFRIDAGVIERLRPRHE